VSSALEIAVRVSAAVGSFEDPTWTAPGVDVVTTIAHDHAFVAFSVGYVPIDNHVYLADGEIVHGSIAGGGWLTHHLRAAAVFDLGYVAYHGDPDLLVDHPGVDLVERNGGVTPFAGAELGYRITRTATAGVYAKVALRELTVFSDHAGDRARARLTLVGAFLEMRLR